MELINRQDAIDIITFECGEWKGLAKEINEQIQRLPSAQPVRHARLVNASPYGECSCCGELIDSRDRFRYCPHCGAKMDAGEAE